MTVVFLNVPTRLLTKLLHQEVVFATTLMPQLYKTKQIIQVVMITYNGSQTQILVRMLTVKVVRDLK